MQEPSRGQDPEHNRPDDGRPKASLGLYFFWLILLQATVSPFAVLAAFGIGYKAEWVVWLLGFLVVVVCPVGFTVVYGRRGRWTLDRIMGWSMGSIFVAGLIGFVMFFGGCLYVLAKHPI